MTSADPQRFGNGRVLLQLCPFAPTLQAELDRLAETVRWYERSDQDGWLLAHGKEVVAIATGGHIGAPPTLVDRLPNLGIVAVNGVGFDKIDLVEMRRRGIRVTTTPDVLTDDVADVAVGLIIALLRGIVPGDDHVRSGWWTDGERPLGRTVSGRRYGIVGLGRIGGAIAHRLSAFGPVSYTGRTAKPVDYTFVPDLIDLAAQVDVLVLAAAANKSSEGLVDCRVLDALGPTGYLVNVSRGSLVDEGDLIDALEQGRIAGAGLDVFADEPRVPAALRALGNVVLTPHIGSATVETRQRMADLLLANLAAFFSGAPLPTALV